ncbi:MAG: amylo-alpha-1,6-glucosidase, partial [Actinomycetota bacterium]
MKERSSEPVTQTGSLPAASEPSPGEFSEPVKVTSPRGEVFDLIGPAGPLKFKSAPGIPTEASEEVLVIKEGAIFLCSRRNGDIRPRVVTGEGLYTQDTRFLSEFQLTLGGTSPILLSSSADLAYAMVVDMTNRNIREDKSVTVPQQTLSVRRFRLMGDRLYERIKLRNYGHSFARTTLELSMAADFADTFEVRGFRKRRTRGNLLVTKPAERGLSFAYVGEDEVFREAIVDFSRQPDELSINEGRAVAVWNIELAPDPSAEFELLVSVEPSLGGKRSKARSLESAEEKVADSHQKWLAGASQIRSDNKVFDGFVRASARDLRALATPVESESIIAAGIPWYVAPFGRDALLTSYFTLMFNTGPARDTLKLLARLQAKVDDPWRDAEPGKILHEIRTGELAGAGIIPHTPYYGSVDSTPLFLMLAAAYYRWTADIRTMDEILPAIDAALKWIDEFGDQDGDGFVEYERRSVSGLTHQGWK